MSIFLLPRFGPPPLFLDPSSSSSEPESRASPFARLAPSSLFSVIGDIPPSVLPLVSGAEEGPAAAEAEVSTESFPARFGAIVVAQAGNNTAADRVCLRDVVVWGITTPDLPIDISKVNMRVATERGEVNLPLSLLFTKVRDCVQYMEGLKAKPDRVISNLAQHVLWCR